MKNIHSLKKALPGKKNVRGLTLVEVMIAMVMGLVAIGAVISVIAMNTRNYRTGEAIGQIQDGMRTAFDFIARDVREARGTGCGNFQQRLIANLPGGAAPPWWPTPSDYPGLRLYGANVAASGVATGTAPAQRAAGVAIEVHGVTGRSFTVTGVAGSTFTAPGNTFNAGDLVIVCNTRNAEVMQVASATGTTVTMATTPINAFSPVTNVPGYSATLLPTITRYSATTWYIGNNAPGRKTNTSLYRVRAGFPAEEIIEGVETLNPAVPVFAASYRLGNDQTLTALAVDEQIPNPAASTTASINAVRLELNFISVDTQVGDTAGGQRLQRNYSNIIAIRNP